MTGNWHPVNTSERWLFGGGEYQFDGTDPIAGSRPAGLDLIRPIWIEGIGGDFNHPRTVFKFPSGTDGIHIHGRIDDLSLNAGYAGISQIGVSARDATMTTVAHGVVVEATCNLSHMLIEFFRGDGLHIVASSRESIPIEKRANAALSRFDSVSVQRCGNSVNVTPPMTRTDRILTITTAGPHQLQIDDIIWLESTNPDPINFPPNPDPNFPRAVCSVESVSGDTFTCRHGFDIPPLLPGRFETESKSYRIVVGHGIYRLGDDANASSCFLCDFRDNAGWAVLENSTTGNSYWACDTTNNGVGPYYAPGTAPGVGNVFMGCWAADERNPSEIDTGIVIGGDYLSPLTGTGLHILGEASTRLAFTNAKGGKVILGHRDPTGPASTRYLEFTNAIDGDSNSLSIDFDQALPLYQKMLGFGMWANHLSPAFLITGPNSVNARWPMLMEPGRLVINDVYWLGITRHQTLSQRPDATTLGDPTWNLGDRAWNPAIVPGGAEGWICTKGGTLGEYSEGRTATTDGTKTVVLNEPSSVLKPGMYLVINGTECVIDSISLDHVTLTVRVNIPQGGPLLIKYNPPEFHKFGSIALQPDPPP